MEITVFTQEGKVPVTVVKLRGDVDASNYAELVTKVEKLVEGGAQDFVIDLSDVPFMSSAGLAGLHTLAMMLRGEQLTNPEAGWAVFKSMDRSRASGMQKHIKLLNPQEGVAMTFEKAGFTLFFEVFKDLQTAVASF
jgi:anti-anti-sigma factor